jgi:hypothetical protein
MSGLGCIVSAERDSKSNVSMALIPSGLCVQSQKVVYLTFH